MCSPPHHRIRQWLKPEQMPGKGVSRPFPAPRTRAGFKQGGLWQFLPRVPGTEGGDRGAKNRERKEGKSSPGGGGRQGAWSSCPHLPQELGEAESAVALEVGDSQGMGREAAGVCLSSHPIPV